jgi:hypothetical protein
MDKSHITYTDVRCGYYDTTMQKISNRWININFKLVSEFTF